MYKCERCGGTFAHFKTPGQCPLCGVWASVRCPTCGHTDSANVFIGNNDRCPKCNSIVFMPGVQQTPFSLSSFIRNRRIVMFVLATIISILINFVRFQIGPKISWSIIYPGIVSLIIYEILYRTQNWLNIRTLILYIIVAIPISSWVYAYLQEFESNSNGYAFSLLPFTMLFSAKFYPYILYDFLETAIVTYVAYWLISTSKD